MKWRMDFHTNLRHTYLPWCYILNAWFLKKEKNYNVDYWMGGTEVKKTAIISQYVHLLITNINSLLKLINNKKTKIDWLNEKYIYGKLFHYENKFDERKTCCRWKRSIDINLLINILIAPISGCWCVIGIQNSVGPRSVPFRYWL